MKLRLPGLMWCAVGLTAGLLIGPVQGADWRDALTTQRGNFPPLPPLTAHYDFGWSGLKAAEAETKFSRTKQGKWQLAITGRTVGAARLLWRMDSEAVSTCQPSSLHPIHLRQVERYSDRTLTTTADFSSTGVQVLRVPKPADKTPPKVRRFKFGEAHDLHSALLFTRSQPLRPGQNLRLCVYPASSPYLAEITVQPREKLKAAGREWNAIRCDLTLQSINKDFTVRPHRKFKRATIWLSDDEHRLPLRLEAEIFVGSVWAELQKVDFAQPAPTRKNS